MRISIIILGILLAVPSSVFADHEDDVHAVAHIGGSFAVETISYGLFHKGLNMNRTVSVLLATATTLLIGFTYKYVENSDAVHFYPDTQKSMYRNGIGIGLSIATIEVFHF